MLPIKLQYGKVYRTINSCSGEGLIRISRLCFIKYPEGEKIIILEKYTPQEVTAAVDQLRHEPRWEHKSLYSQVLKALRSMEGRLADELRTIDHIMAIVSSDPGFAEVTGRAVRKAVTDLAGASQGGLILRDDRVIVNASMGEVERRLSSMTGDSGEPRTRGSFWDGT